MILEMPLDSMPWTFIKMSYVLVLQKLKYICVCYMLSGSYSIIVMYLFDYGTCKGRNVKQNTLGIKWKERMIKIVIVYISDKKQGDWNPKRFTSCPCKVQMFLVEIYEWVALMAK